MKMKKTKKRKGPVFIEEHLCVFCLNRNVNELEDNFKMFTAKICGHEICEVCLDSNIFVKLETPCAECGAKIKKTQVSSKSKDELEYERVVDIRKKVKSEFNLRREDFSSSPTFNAYQELAEEVIHRMIERKDDAWIKQQFELNLKEHRDKIAKNTSIRAEEEQRILEKLKDERREELLYLQELQKQEYSAKLAADIDALEMNLLRIGDITETSKQKQKNKGRGVQKFEGIMEDDRPKNEGNLSLFWQQAAVNLPHVVKDIKKELNDSPVEEMAIAGGYSDEFVREKAFQLMHIV